MVVYNTAAGLFQKYQAGSWEDDTAGGTTPNGSTTVAGKYELATQTENDNGTTTGATGATLVASPTLTALTSQKGIQTYATASGTNTYSATLAPAVAALTD